MGRRARGASREAVPRNCCARRHTQISHQGRKMSRHVDSPRQPQERTTAHHLTSSPHPKITPTAVPAASPAQPNARRPLAPWPHLGRAGAALYLLHVPVFTRENLPNQSIIAIRAQVTTQDLHLHSGHRITQLVDVEAGETTSWSKGRRSASISLPPAASLAT